MCRSLLQRVGIVFLAASAFLVPVPAKAQTHVAHPQGMGMTGNFGRVGGFDRFGGVGRFGRAGGFGFPFGPFWPGLYPFGLGGLGAYGLPFGYGAYPYLAGGFGYPGFFNYGAGGYPGVTETFTTAGWAVGPGSEGFAWAPRIRLGTLITYEAPVPAVALGCCAMVPSDPAVVDVVLPYPSAQVWIQGVQTKQTGTVRRYVSPALPPASDFVYSIRARWQDPQGQIQVHQENVIVRTGAQLRVAFPR